MRRLAVALIVLLLIAVPGCSGGPVVTPAEKTPVRLKLLIRNVDKPLEESFSQGQTVRVFDTKALLGTVTAVEIEPAVRAVPDSTGTLRVSASPLQMDITLTIEGEAVVSNESYAFDGTTVWLNNDIDYLTPLTRFKGILISIEEI